MSRSRSEPARYEELCDSCGRWYTEEEFCGVCELCSSCCRCGKDPFEFFSFLLKEGLTKCSSSPSLKR